MIPPLLLFAVLVSQNALPADAPPAEPPKPVPWSITGTSSIAEIPALPLGHRIERRWFHKDGRLIARTGASYWSRGDLRVNPGLSLDVGWYPEETVGIDLVSATVFFSTLSSTALALRKSTGLLPDSQQPFARLMTGARYSFAYGKLLAEAFDTVLHFDASAAAHVGLIVTDVAPNLGGDLGLGMQVGVGSHVLVWVEVSVVLSYEERTTSDFAAGPLGTLGLGWIW